MKLFYLTCSLLQLVGVFALSDETPNDPVDLALNKRDTGSRACDYSDGYYVDWADLGSAAASWCRAHAGQVTQIGTKTVKGDIYGYKSGKWNVQLTVKYQNDHFDAGWEIDEDACNWYLNYIAQGCTPGGNNPTDAGKQLSDGGTYYEPLMGSVDFKWVYSS